MILGYNANVGSAVILGESVPNIQLSSFNSITFGGSHTMVVSNVWGQSQVPDGDDGWTDMTTEYLDNYNHTDAIWTSYTYLLANFNNDLSAGSLKGLGDIISWSLYRVNTTDNEASFIGNFDADVKTYVDYTGLKSYQIGNSKYNYYKYLLYAKGTLDTSSALISDEVSLNYYGYFLIDVTNDVVYKFDTNFSGGDLTQNTDYSAFMTNNKYQTYHVGELNYLSTQITALVRYANSNNYINNDVGVLQNLRDCVQDGSRIKILKTRKGEGWYVFTYNYQDAVVNQAIGEQPVNASFSCDEIGNLINGIDNQTVMAVY